MTFSGNQHSKTSYCLLFSAALLFTGGCGAKSSVRTLPKETAEYLDVDISSYSSKIPPEFLEMKSFATERQTLQLKGNLPASVARRFEHDPRLDVVAFIYSRSWNDEISRPAGSMVDWVLRKLGVNEERIDTRMWWVSNYAGSPSVRLDQNLHQWARDFEDESGGDKARYSFGLARVKDATVGWCQALVVTRRAAIIDDVPKHYERDGVFKITGRILTTGERTTLSMTLDNIEGFDAPVKVSDDGSFSFEAPVPKTPGRYMVEMETMVGPMESVTIFEAPIYVETPEPLVPDEMIMNPLPNPGSTEEISRQLLTLINAERTKLGLVPLRWNAKTAALMTKEAKASIEDWRSESTDVETLLRRAKLHPRSYAMLRIYSESLHERFWMASRSPWFRENMLNPKYTQLGVGTEKTDGDFEYYQSFLLFTGEEAATIVLPDEIGAVLATGVGAYDDPNTQARLVGAGWTTIRGIDEVIDEAVGPETKRDSALDQIALLEARNIEIDSHLRRWLEWKLGVTGDTFGVYRSIHEGEEISRHMIASMKADMEFEDDDAEKLFVFGTARVPLNNGVFKDVVVVVEKEVELFEPLPTVYHPGDEIVLKGRFRKKTKEPRMIIDLGGGRISTWDIVPDKDGYFVAKLPTPSDAGTHMLEITGDFIEYKDRRLRYGLHSVLMVPIDVVVADERPASDAHLETMLAPPPPNPEDAESWVGIVKDRLNGMRREQGLSPLRDNPVADAVIADKLYRAMSSWKEPGFDVVNDIMKRNGAGSLGMLIVRPTWGLSRSIDELLLEPSLRESLFDADTTMMTVVLGFEENVIAIGFVKDDEKTDKKEGQSRNPGVKIARELGGAVPKIGRLDEATFKKTPKKNIIEVARCYQRLGEIDEDAEGDLDVTVAIGEGGKVIGAFPGASTLRFEEAQRCVVDKVRGWRFESPVDGVYLNTLTFKLAKRGTKQVVQLK